VPEHTGRLCICNQCISPLKLWILIPLMARCTASLSVTCDMSVVFSTNKYDRHDITEKLLKVVLNTITPNVLYAVCIRTNWHHIFFQTNVITFYKIKSTKVKKNHQWSFKCNQNIIYLNILLKKPLLTLLIKIKSSDQMFTACVCIGDCLIFKHIMKSRLLCMDFYSF
jgi:hypothetical protein